MLTQEQADEAKEIFFSENLKLGELAERIGCGIYDLTPWIMEWSRDPRAKKDDAAGVEQ